MANPPGAEMALGSHVRDALWAKDEEIRIGNNATSIATLVITSSMILTMSVCATGASGHGDRCMLKNRSGAWATEWCLFISEGHRI
jgi:hypothetical protein